MGSVVVVHGLSCSEACRIFLEWRFGDGKLAVVQLAPSSFFMRLQTRSPVRIGGDSR